MTGMSSSGTVWPICRRGFSLLALLLALSLSAPAFAQGEPEAAEAEAQAEEAEAEENGEAEEGEESPQLAPVRDRRLPDSSVIDHEIAIDGQTLRFTTTAGAITLTGDEDEPEAEIGFIAYTRRSADAVSRPVTFVVNGGPGAASAYLHLMVLGPWRLDVGADNIVPSQPVDLEANPQTWLEFTDLVFIDPVGTGFSRLVEPNRQLRNQYLSIDGDIGALSDVVYRWLVENERVASPKYFAGESYGGFRGPLLADELQSDYGIGLNGMTLVSPVLDFGWREQPEYAPLPYVSLLPSYAAARMEMNGTISQQDLQAVEAYAASDYVVDFLQGLEDEAAVDRIVERVAEITGLDEQLVERHSGRIDRQTFVRALLRDEGRIASPYDTGVTAGDPTPERPFSRARDPVLDALTAPLTSAMLAHYQDTLEWLPERRYVLLNQSVSQAWEWDEGRSQPEAVSALRRVLALDRTLEVLVVHGYTDLVTPYFESELILRQLGDFDEGERVRLETYPGGHMFYTRAEARRAFRSDARRLYGSGDR
ncbi:MAG: peptidase S10 [Gammaproteobacteria bacterium]